MATAKQAKTGIITIILRIAVMVALAAAVVAFFFGEAIAGFADTGTGYAAKSACSCRHIAGRELGSCYDDLMPGMGMIWLTEDETAQSVTATLPMIASTEATFSEGPGCVLEPWGG